MKKDKDLIKELADAVKIVTGGSIMENSRVREAVEGRFIAAKILRAHEGWGFMRIARALGKKNHATIIHGVRTITDYCATDSKTLERFQKVFEIYADDNTPYKNTQPAMLKKHLLARDERIIELDLQLSKLKEELIEAKSVNGKYTGLFKMLENRLPVDKIEEAKKRFNTMLNGI